MEKSCTDHLNGNSKQITDTPVLEDILESRMVIFEGLVDNVDRCLENQQQPTKELLRGLVHGWEDLKSSMRDYIEVSA